MNQVTPLTLELVGRELNASLSEARASLETFAEQPENALALERTATELHRAQGVLRMLEIYGGALLAEEAEHVSRYLIETGTDRRNHPECLDALLRALVQLPAYLDRVLAGGRDLALVLLPLLNDLRAVRGSPLLSEGTLLLLNLKSDRQPAPAARTSSDAPVLSLPQMARRLRTQFQLGLVGWIRNEGHEQNLAALAQVSSQIERAATHQPVFQLWWVTGALIEALQENGIEGSVSVKRLLGLADRELKRLYEQGEARYSQTPPVELLNNLLYYIARSQSHGPRVSAVRGSFRLEELLPVDRAVEEERDTLSAPSIKLMQTVAAAIREDLGKVKDTLDIFMRRGSGQPGELAPQVELLRKIGDTLGVLGLGDLRASVQTETERLNEIAEQRVSPTESLLIDIATTLISVEDRLDGSLLRLIVPRRRDAGQAADVEATEDTPESGLRAEEFVQVQAAVLRECIVNLARIKESIAQNVGGTLDAGGLDAWPDLMRGIKAGLLLLGRTRAVGIIDRITVELKRIMQPGGVSLPAGYMDRLADSIVSLEYYMETLQAGRTEPAYMLDNAQISLEALVAAPENVAPTVPPIPALQFARTVRLTPVAQPSVGVDVLSTLVLTEETTPNITTSLSRGTPPTLSPAPADATAAMASTGMFPNLGAGRRRPDVDPELLEIFIEEAREEAARIKQYFPEWNRNPADAASLSIIRRSFHTLKGSGRMVGAGALAEFAWSVENLVNRLLDGTLVRTPAIATVLRESVELAPALIEQLAGGPAPPADAEALAARAHALAVGKQGGDDSSPVEPARNEPAVAALPASETYEISLQQGLEPEPEIEKSAEQRETEWEDRALREIYLRETDAHVVTVQQFIVEARSNSGPHLLPEPVYRACHTLSGSSKMAEARHGTRLAEPLDRWLRKAFGSGVGLDHADLELLDQCMRAMQQVARNLDESTMFFAPHDVLRERLAAADVALDARIADQGEIENIELATIYLPAPQFSQIETDDVIADSAPAVESAAAPTVDAAYFDPEIAAIFVEEASELIEATQAALQDWSTARDEEHRTASLKRPLHTLKGGARMAGLTAMGDLAHELETAIEQIESGGVTGSDQVLRLLQSSVDELARMRDTVAAGQPPDAATTLVQRLRAIDSPEPFPSEAADAARGLDDSMIVESASSGEFEAIELSTIVEDESVFIPEPTVLVEIPSQLAVPPGREPMPHADRAEMARVDADLLDQMLNQAGEVSIGRARLEQQVGSIDHNLGELSRTVTRLKEQLRNLEIETEKQILNRYEGEAPHRGDFDPLELDRYSSIQQFSRALAETASDVASIQQLLESLTQDTQNLLQQQARVVNELQNGLMRTRMVPFQRHAQRLLRIVRQAAAESGKQAELVIEGASGELDRQVLERMLPPFEHLLRNAVVHGIETPEVRLARGKDETGRIQMQLRRDGSEVVLEIADDGAGMNLAAIRAKGAAIGLISPDQTLSDSDVMQLVLEPGFSTATRVTQQAGRGVGMDVVATEVKKLGGALHMDSREGEGTRFTIRLPFTLAISHALVVRVDDELYALPLPTVEGVVRLPREEVAVHLAGEHSSYEYSGQRYRLQPLANFVGLTPSLLSTQDATVPVVMVRAGDHSTGLVADELIGSREIVVKNVGPQISGIRGVAGATILGDGRIVIILDIGALVRADSRGRTARVAPRDKVDARPVALVVDDSITVRRVTQRLLERNGMRVLTARDGVDAVEVLAEHTPDIILLDIEMPRMDGYEVAAHVRSDARLQQIPIIMITSRVGEKHRARAIEVGVDDYLGKPYQEAQLLEAIAPLIERHREQRKRATR